MWSPSHRRRSAFTMVELFVAIAIISVLIALLLPAIQQSREVVRRTQCKNSLRQISLAMYNYEGLYGQFPIPAVWSMYMSSDWVADSGGGPNGDQGRQVYGRGYPVNAESWGVALLPFLDEASLYNSFDNSQPFYSQTTGTNQRAGVTNCMLMETSLEVFECPSVPASVAPVAGLFESNASNYFTDGISGAGSAYTVAPPTGEVTRSYFGNSRTGLLMPAYGRSDYIAMTALLAPLCLYSSSSARSGFFYAEDPHGGVSGVLGNVNPAVSFPVYTGVVPNITVYQDGSPMVKKVTDGLSNTMMISEFAGRPTTWYRGRRISAGTGFDAAVIGQIFYSGGGWGDPNNSLLATGNSNTGIEPPGLWGFNVTNYYGCSQGGGLGYSFHPGICNVVMGDGSVRSVNEMISLYTAVALFTRDGSEALGDF